MAPKNTQKRKWVRKAGLPAIAYTIPLPFGEVLQVKTTSNAWWMDPQKIHSLIAAFRIGLTIDYACLLSGITTKQYKYFIQLHPNFTQARRGYNMEPDLRARITVAKALEKDVKIAKWWLERKLPEEFGSFSRRGRRMTEPTSLTRNQRNNLSLEQNIEIEKVTKEWEEKMKKILIYGPSKK